MADAGGAFVTRAFEKLLKDASHRKYANLQDALKAYLDRPRENVFSNIAIDAGASVPKGEEEGEAGPEEVVGIGTNMNAAATMAEAGQRLEGLEAELVVLPLRLAIDSKQSKLIETALDCIHKLIAYGHLEGDAGLEGGRNAVLMNEIFHLVCNCADNTAIDSCVLQVIKVLLTAVASPTFCVHGEALVLAIRTCYNIVLNTRHPVNLTTAKATLTQMINIVFKRMEVVEDDSAAAPVGGSDVKGLEAAFDTAVRPLPGGAGEAVGEGMDLESLGVGCRDALLVFRTLCKMAMKDGQEELITRTKVLSLELLQELLEGCSAELQRNPPFLDSMKMYLCYALVRAYVSTVDRVFQLACAIFTVLLSRFRESLKAEIGLFFPLVVLRSLDSAESPWAQRQAVLRMLEYVCNDPQLLADVFVNYDCDLDSTNLFERTVSSLSRIAQGRSIGETVNQQQNAAVLKTAALQCLMLLLNSLATWSRKDRLPPPPPPLEGEGAEAEDVASGEEVGERSQAHIFGKAKAHKSTLEAGVAEFNLSPKRGLTYLEAHKVVKREPAAVAHFLRTSPGLNKTVVGEYLGEHGEFNVAVMHAYVDGMEFGGKSFVAALRELLNGFRLPGEAQKIDRMMEKFAERYCVGNPGVFKSADTAYVLAYAVIMLNTDAHNPVVLSKMTAADFVRMNAGVDGEEGAPVELLERIYASIVQNEIKLKEGGEERGGGARGKGQLVSVLNLAAPRHKAGADTKGESEEIVRRTQEAVRAGGAVRGVFHTATHADLSRPMLEAVGWPLLAAFSVTMDDTDSKPRVVLCMEGFRQGIRLTRALGMETMRYAFLTSLVRFTYLHAPREMRSKNCEALKTLLQLAECEAECLQDTWNAVLECLSRLDHITTTPSLAQMLVGPAPQAARQALLAALTEVAGKPSDQLFVSSQRLPSDAVVEFFRALCGVSAEELRSTPPRVFSLQKLVEMSYYNMGRIRMVWGRIWTVLSAHFVIAGGHSDPKIAMYAIDSLRQLAIKYLERAELAAFSFQNDILKPFVVIMRSSRAPAVRELIVQCTLQMVASKLDCIKSGWRSVFMVLTTAAADSLPPIVETAFGVAEQVVLEHFDAVAGECFLDTVHCLLAFANNKVSARLSLKAIALLRICEERLADGRIPVLEGEAGGSEHLWFPMLAGLSLLTADPREEIRTTALSVLFDILSERGRAFPPTLWERILERVLFPIFDYVRSEGSVAPAAWQRETCISCLHSLISLFCTFYRSLAFLLPNLLALLLDCAARPDQGLAAVAVGALLSLMEAGGERFTEQEWSVFLDSIRVANQATRPTLLQLQESSTATEDSSLVATTTVTVSSSRGGEEGEESSREEEEGGWEGEVEVEVEVGVETETKQDPPPSPTSFGRSFMDSLLMKSPRVPEPPPPPPPPPPAPQEVEVEVEVSEEASGPQPLSRTACYVQLLLLNVLDQLQSAYWPRLGPAQKRELLDLIQASTQLAAAYNSHHNLRWRMSRQGGDRPPSSLLRQEVVGTQLYLTALLRAIGDPAATALPPAFTHTIPITKVEVEVEVEVGVGDGKGGSGTVGVNVEGQEEEVRKEAMERLLRFCGDVLEAAAALQPNQGEAVEEEVHRSLAMRSPVVAKVLLTMSCMEEKTFRSCVVHLYPFYTRLICSDHMEIRKALGELFKTRLMPIVQTIRW